MTGRALIWLRRDLRLADSAAVHFAVERGMGLAFVFVLDDRLIHGSSASPARTAFMLAGLRSVAASISQLGGRLIVVRGRPEDRIPEIARTVRAEVVVANRDYSPYARHRDDRVAKVLSPIPLTLVQDRLLVEPNQIETGAGKPYTVFTPFKNKWLGLPKAQPEPLNYSLEQRLIEVPEDLLKLVSPIESLELNAAVDLPPAGESEALTRLETFCSGSVYAYQGRRNRLADPFDDPRNGTSSLSPYIRWGMLSPRQIREAAARAYRGAPDESSRASVTAWMNEIIWHEFYTHILWHFPRAAYANFSSAYDHLEWRQADDEFEAWAEGMTGYPAVDAAMRQLRTTGWMHNRARMIVASFLTKDLLIDWRRGAAWFMQHLLDGDIAANSGGWQWAASTGTDAQPYFRIFNPVTQSEKFDPDGTFIRRWLPELESVPAKYIHAPWTAPSPPRDYPSPIVDHGVARVRALEAFKGASL